MSAYDEPPGLDDDDEIDEDLALEPAVLTATLRHFGWVVDESVPGSFEFWVRPDFSMSGLTVPLNPNSRSYISGVNRAVYGLIAEHGQSAKETLDLLNLREKSGLEQTTWRKQSSVLGGVISWLDGEVLVESARRQLEAAARSAAEPRSRHLSHASHVAKSFIDQSFMGQTEVGSFIITAYAPARARFYKTRTLESVAKGGDPTEAGYVTGRTILETLQNGLEAARASLDAYAKTPRVEVFTEAVPNGVSYELAMALAEMTVDGDIEVTVGVTAASQPKAIEFHAVDVPVLRRAAEQLAPVPEAEPAFISGEVTLLRSGTGERFRTVGLTNRDGDPEKVRVRLTAEQYEIAIEAHRDRRYFTAHGSLERESRLWWLYHVDEVALGEEISSPPSQTGEQSELEFR